MLTYIWQCYHLDRYYILRYLVHCINLERDSKQKPFNELTRKINNAERLDKYRH